MSPIEEIRRLRGAAPTMSASELVDAALANASVFKWVVAELDRRRAAPDLAACERVVRAYAEGRASAWLAAVLLGRVGHPAGHPTLLAIARSGDEQARGYLVEAIGRLADPGAAEGFVALLRDGETQRSRSTAARAIGALGARSAIPEVAAAAAAGRIGFRAAREALVALDVDDARVAGWLASDAPRMATLGCHVVFERLERQGDGPSASLAPAVLAAVAPSLLRYEEEALRAWAEGSAAR